MPRAALLAAADGWHIAALARAFAAAGWTTERLDPTRMVGRVGEPASEGTAPRASHGGDDPQPTLNQAMRLEEFDAIVVRLVPPGSLDQIVFRIDALHLLADRGVVVVNHPRALERTIDKHWTTRLLDDAGLPTPRTVVTEKAEEAQAAFATMGDALVKPLLGSGGRGIVRVSDPDLAWRVFRALAQQRAVIYLQEFVPHGRHDLRLFVVGGEVIAAALREGASWRTNVAAGAVTRPHRPGAAEDDLARRAARAVGADYAGVDLLPSRDGSVYVLEVNGIPGWQGLQRATGVDVAAAIVGRLECPR